MKTENNLQPEDRSLDVDRDDQTPLKLRLASKRKWLKWVGLIILVIGGVGGYIVWKSFSTKRDFSTTVEMTNSQVQDDGVAKKTDIVKFTHDIFDVSKIKFIAPLGELNGGYNETQPITGICVNNKDATEVDVFAPTDMVLESYSYAGDGRNTANYHLGFIINQDMKLSFDHITWVPEAVRVVAPPTQSSATVQLKEKISFKAGELIAKTSGTDRAHNWNIYLTDKKVTNRFANQARYEQIKDRYAFLNAACPFDYYEEANKQLYLALMGATKAGQSATCGNPSKDVKGSISGLWHLSQTTDNSTFMGSYTGNYATPFSIYKNSAGEIILYEIGRKRYILGANNPTSKDPATVTDSHCYNLTEWPESRPNGYAYFKIVSDMEMKMSYSPTGSCPTSFPANPVTYYR